MLVVTIDDRRPADIRLRPGFSVVTYTSGSTGTPKGVRLGIRQVGWSARALAKASGATSDDRHLSLLPLSLLLEMISAIFVPLVVEGATFFDRDMAEAVGRGRAGSLAAAFERHHPTTAVLVPQLLKVWAAELAATTRRAPSSLRFVAVGGAPVPLAVAETAIRLGIPVHEGYGLSECCSVVALNRPEQRVPGTVGQPLDGLSVTLDEGEIVVAGPSVTDGYLGRPDHKGAWRTGDLGQFDADGNLTILGRKDNLIVTDYGRNVSPEWVETILLNDQRLMLACLSGGAEAPLTALLIPAPYAEKAVLDISSEELTEQVARLTASLPTYARPERVVALSLIGAKTAGLLTDNGRVRRAAVTAFLKTSAPVAV
jgi:long-subunit acyl-CoA synthetase (AMP-forming)